MDAADFKRAEELLSDPDAEDCERFASWYGRTLLDTARAAEVMLSALKVAQHSLVTSEGLRCTDLSEDDIACRVDDGAVRSDLEFSLDHTAALREVDAAIAKATGAAK